MIDEEEAVRHERVSARLRQKGDALRQRGDLPGATNAYDGALSEIDLALTSMSVNLTTGWPPVPTDRVSAAQAGRVADLLGVRGGLLRRLDRGEEARMSYNAGAELERDYGLVSTYNRTNATKLGLLSGAISLDAAKQDLLDLQNALERRLRADETAADDAWLWADLGDCRLLLGDTRGADTAYRVFVQKAETRSPLTTLEVLRELSAALTAHGDPHAADVARSLGVVESVLSG